MLRKLAIRNYAIIDHLELIFSEKLTVITGETGAGKSIAIEALSLVLGERADANVLFEKEKNVWWKQPLIPWLLNFLISLRQMILILMII